MARNPRKINPDMPATAISFDKDVLELLKKIAANEDRSLASLVRRVVNSWLESSEGKEFAERANRTETHRATWGDHPRIAEAVQRVLQDDSARVQPKVNRAKVT
jgi:hypothetical protein